MHRTLTGAAALQALPASGVALALFADAALVGLFWSWRGDLTAALLVALGVLAACFANWELLRRLPLQERSFGPDKPVALALGAAIALIATALGLFGASALLTLLIIFIISVVAYYATWIEPFALGVTRQKLPAKNWHGETKPLRLLHVSDIHVERTSPRERELNALIESLQPDIVVFTGDFVNISYTHNQETKADIRAIIREWNAPLGVYCVPGTPVVEPLTRVMEFVEGLENLTFLANRWVTVETPNGALHILGMITTHDLKTDREALARLMRSAPEGGLKLLLAHSPDIAPEAAGAGIDLYLCGHTHGGQIRIPVFGALLTSSQLGKRFEMGRYQVGAGDQRKSMTLYTSRGVGMEGHGAPRARLFCPPEVILWEIFSEA
jgi:predicted MPP superfamily phosphohydrolase